jgi:hypothetical protein
LWRAGLNPFAASVVGRAPSLSDLAVVSGMDHEEAPIEFLATKPESVVQKGVVE